MIVKGYEIKPRAYLSGADLSEAVLRGAYLSGAVLREAVLREADLSGADLRGAYLSGADLSEAYLSGADLSETKLPHFQIVPSEGGFRAWKKIDEYVLKLFIPAHAKRTSCLINRKCRASEVETLEIFGPTTSKTVFISSRGGHYSIGKITRADKFCDDIRTDCSHGIHFFMTREEAEEWYD